MYNYFFIALLSSFIISCKTTPGSSREYDKFDPARIYKLQLNPAPGASYHYDIVNSSETELEVNGEETSSRNKNTVGILFKTGKDSAGNFLLTMQYDRIRIYSKNGETETELDASRAQTTPDPVERMLGYLKDAVITSTVNTKGETIHISGYKEIGDKIISQFAPEDTRGKTIAREQWEKQVGNKLVKNNMDQLFKLFPDSAVHLRDTWRLTSKQEGELSLVSKNTYRLKAINSDIALISAKGTISNDKSHADIMGMSGVKADLEGEQEGEFEMETRTGMLISCTMKATVKGSIHVMGREIPIVIKTTVKVNGRRL